MGEREMRAQPCMDAPAAGGRGLRAQTYAVTDAVAGESGRKLRARVADVVASPAVGEGEPRVQVRNAATLAGVSVGVEGSGESSGLTIGRDARARRSQACSWLRRLALAPSPAVPAVKLCGLTCGADVGAALDAGADLLGFVTDVPRSRRSLEPRRVLELCAYAREYKERRVRDGAGIAAARGAGQSAPHGLSCSSPHPPWSVAVCVDLPPARLVELLVAADGPDMVQLHGHEDASYIAELRSRLAAAGVDAGIIQAFRVRGEDGVARANASAADFVLLDAGAGCGEAFDWGLASLCTRPFFLAGGLGPGNLSQAAAQVHPWAVDMSSGIETNGMKDPTKMRAAVRRVRALEGEHIYE